MHFKKWLYQLPRSDNYTHIEMSHYVPQIGKCTMSQKLKYIFKNKWIFHVAIYLQLGFHMLEGNFDLQWND